jgi:hypothetical protein
MKMNITIEKVEHIEGREFKGTKWESRMQVIHTKTGYLFIDNDIGKCFGQANIKWKGIDWKKYIGKTVEILVVNCIGKEIASSDFKPVCNIEELKSNLGGHYRNCPNHNWAYPLFLLGSPQK